MAKTAIPVTLGSDHIMLILGWNGCTYLVTAHLFSRVKIHFDADQE